jgi:hypothetical protein
LRCSLTMFKTHFYAAYHGNGRRFSNLSHSI